MKFSQDAYSLAHEAYVEVPTLADTHDLRRIGSVMTLSPRRIGRTAPAGRTCLRSPPSARTHARAIGTFTDTRLRRSVAP